MTCDLPTFYSWTEPVARRRHACCECRAPIEPGEKHFHGRGKWDGKISTYRQHLACCAACELIRDEFSGGECVPFGNLMAAWSDLRGYFDRASDRDKKAWKPLRALMAQILWREREAK